MAAARGVNAGEIAQGCADNPQRIPDLVHRARVMAVKMALRLDDVGNVGNVDDADDVDGGDAG